MLAKRGPNAIVFMPLEAVKLFPSESVLSIVFCNERYCLIWYSTYYYSFYMICKPQTNPFDNYHQTHYVREQRFRYVILLLKLIL